MTIKTATALQAALRLKNHRPLERYSAAVAAAARRETAASHI